MTDSTAEGPSHHLYVHVPFCRLLCAYCDFVTVGGRAADIPRYVDGLVAEIGLRPADGELRTISFGGGTPSLLAPEQVARVIDAAKDRWSRFALAEVSLEANPSRRERPDWAGLRDAGVTRISLGVQSLLDADLVALARGHDAAEAREAFARARDAGFESVSIDLIYGIPGQGIADWADGLEAAIVLGPDHISCYALQLILAPDEWAAVPRSGALRWRRRMADLQDDAVAAEQYRLAESMLADAGYRHYELSSWARPGHESRHNGAYWARRPYTGVGAGAHSFDGLAERSWNVGDLDAYLAAVEAGRRPLGGKDPLDEPARAFEAMALGLRLIDGLQRRSFADEFGSDPLARWKRVASDFIEVTPERLRLTPDGRLFASEALLPFLPATG
ncbi:MAG TPA: radical SAM family heme chaperone HemW [Candidatus Limnocylindria bacterium]|nr:radical SAM family heme chaperone HemW [Candidatus Limnocylindria bacterium]